MKPSSDTWQVWEKALGKIINAAEVVGISDDFIDGVAYRLADWLADTIDPLNREQRLLKNMWVVANEDEQKTLARIIVRMIDTNQNQQAH